MTILIELFLPQIHVHLELQNVTFYGNSLQLLVNMMWYWIRVGNPMTGVFIRRENRTQNRKNTLYEVEVKHLKARERGLLATTSC